MWENIERERVIETFIVVALYVPPFAHPKVNKGLIPVNLLEDAIFLRESYYGGVQKEAKNPYHWSTYTFQFFVLVSFPLSPNPHSIKDFYVIIM